MSKEKSKVQYETLKPSYFEFGKAGSRWKLYFEEAEDLKKKIEDLKEAGLLIEEDD